MSRPAEQIEVGRRNLLGQLRRELRARDLEEYPVDAATMRDLIEVLEAVQPAPGRWWICTNWLTPHNRTDAPGLKVAGPFRDQNEAIENRARIERYTRGVTFFVDEEPSS